MSFVNGSLLRTLLPVAAILLLVAGAAIGLHLLRGEPREVSRPDSPPEAEPPAARPDLPDWLAPERAATLRKARGRIREAAGRDAEAVALLLEILSDLAGQPGRIAEILEILRTDLRVAFHSGDPQAAVSTLLLLSTAHRHGDDRARAVVSASGFRLLISEGLAHAEPRIRSAAVHLLHRIGDLQARRQIISVLEDPDPEIRKAAIRAYAAMTPPPSRDRLHALFESEGVTAVRVALLEVLGAHRSLRGRPTEALEHHVLREGSEAERLQVIHNLTLNRDHQDLSPFLSLLTTGSPSLRSAVLRTLLVMPDRRALDEVRAYFQAEEDEKLRMLAGEVLEAIR